jgi:hypothetical protein
MQLPALVAFAIEGDGKETAFSEDGSLIGKLVT